MFPFGKSALSKAARGTRAKIERAFKEDLLPVEGLSGKLPDGCPVLLAVQPTTQQRMAELVRMSIDGDCMIVPMGRPDQLPLIHPPECPRPVILVSTCGLRRKIAYSIEEKKITVESGVTLSELAGLVGAGDLHLPIDVSDPDDMTIGEAVAINAFGPRRLKYGTMKDYVLGCNVILADGSILECSPHRSQIHGRDMTELVVGSRGAMGIITQVTLRLEPLPEAFHMAMVFLPSAADGEYAIKQLLKSDVKPAVICLANAQGSRYFNYSLEGEQMLLFVGYEESAKCFEEQMRPVYDLFEDDVVVLEAQEDGLDEFCEITYWYHEGCEFEIVTHQNNCGVVLEYCSARGIPAMAHPDLGLVRGYAAVSLDGEFLSRIGKMLGSTGSLTFKRWPILERTQQALEILPADRRIPVFKEHLDPGGLFPIPGICRVGSNKDAA